MLNVGKFQCKVTAPRNGWFGEAGENATPFIRIPFIVTEDGPCEGHEDVYMAWISDKALARTIKNLAEVFNWNGDLAALSKLTNTGPFVGKEFSITTEEEEFKGKKSVKIKWLNAAGGGGKTMEKGAAETLAQRLNRRAMEAASEIETPPERPSSPPRPPADPDLDAPEDDIPF